MPPCPPWLDDEAKAEWNRIVPELQRLNLLTIVDGATLAGYCQAYADFRDSVETLQREGKTNKTDKGYIIQHPAVAMKNKAMLIMAKFAAEFGFSPASRTRIQTAPREKEPEEKKRRFFEAG